MKNIIIILLFGISLNLISAEPNPCKILSKNTYVKALNYLKIHYEYLSSNNDPLKEEIRQLEWLLFKFTQPNNERMGIPQNIYSKLIIKLIDYANFKSEKSKDAEETYQFIYELRIEAGEVIDPIAT